MNYQAIIFDMDGTIIDTEQIWQQATLELIRTRGVVLDQKDQDLLHACLRGMGMTNACTLLKDRYNLHDEIKHLVTEKSKHAVELYRQKVCFIQGFITFHNLTITHNLKTGIATNADDDTLLITNEILNLKQFFGEHIYGISCVNYKAKPDPAIYLHAAQQLNIHPEQCIAIEDSAHGIQAARAAGMFCIGINTSGNADALHASNLIVNNYQEILLSELLFNPK